MSVYVHYRVPLVVEVELSTQEVLSVHVVDEAIEGPLDVRDDGNERVGRQKRARAMEIAETAMWRGWISGF